MLHPATCTLRPYQQRLVDKAVAMFLGEHRNGADELEPAARSVMIEKKAVFEGTAIRKLEDAPVADVDGWLAAQQAAGAMAAQTRKHFATHLKQFGRYLVREAIVAESPFADVTLAVHVESDRRLQRRALTADEMRRLLESVAKSPTVRCRLPGPTRRLVYWVAGTTGLRRNEIAALTPESFDFSGPTPQVRVAGQHTKNRRRADLPLRSDLAAELQSWLVGKPPGEPVFPIRGAATHTMIAHDLKEAGIEAAKDGRRVDFHALRTTTVTSLALSGVPLAVAQKIARHSTPTLTANVYAVVGVDELQKAVEKLPSFVQNVDGDDGDDIDNDRAGPGGRKGLTGRTQEPFPGEAVAQASRTTHTDLGPLR
jgi:integrase